MESLVKKIISKKDNLQTELISSGFDLDYSTSNYDGKSIKSILNDLSTLLKSSIQYFNKKSFTLSVFYSGTEIQLIEDSLTRIDAAFDECEKQLRDENGERILLREDVQQNNDIFDIPNISATSHERRLRPRLQLSLYLIPSELDNLKPYLRVFAFKGAESRGDSYRKLLEDQIALENLKDEFVSNLDYAQRYKKEANDCLTSIEDYYDKVGNIHESAESKFNDLGVELDKINKKIESVTNSKNEWDDKLTEMEEIKDSVENVHSRIDELYKSSGDIRRELKALVEVAEDNNQKATNIIEYFDEKANELERVKEKAISILNITGTVSLGQFFKEQHSEAKENVNKWLWASSVLLICAVAVCVWALWSFDAASEIPYLFSRLSIVPLILAGLWFCSSQYIKQKHIIEDYAYKKVLALSMVSFRNELTDNSPDSVTEYVKSVLDQLHQPPLDSLEKNQFKEESKMLRGIQSEVFKEVLGALKSRGQDKENLKDIKDEEK
ncbi:hypothetical protein [Scandinavium goeteborgense]|uniref:hypothetical protein n=1 Tax=Scandinavium goeteborgense TaxID=1851514 RepID=UPI000F659ACF|nr:hypothetical protein [Scandinavium goeteborgense]QKN81356.1 hypothetical protein A8O29_008735 [Scandinavium goeteborgense]